MIFYQESYDLLEKLGDQRRMASTLSNIANVYSDRSEYDQALSLFKQASDIHERLNDQRGLAADYNNIGLIYDELGNYLQARQNYQKALAINTRMDNSRNMAKNMANLGNVCINLGDYEEAIDLYQRTLAFRQQTGDRKGEGNDYGNMGIIYDQLGEYQQAEGYYRKAIQLHEETGYQEGLAYQYGRLAGMYMKKGEYALAIGMYQDALKIHREMGHTRGEAYWLESLGLVYANVGDFSQAFDYLNQALARHEQIGNISGQAGALSKLGHIHIEKLQFTEAENCFLKALGLHRSLDEKHGICLDLCNLAYLNYREEKTGAGITFCLQADSLARMLKETGVQTWIEVQMGDLYRKNKDIRASLRAYDRGLAISEGLNLREIRWQLYFGKGKSLEALKENDQAGDAYSAAINIIEALRGSAVIPEFKAGLLHDRFEAYEAMISLLVKSGRVEEALNYLERSRARNMLDMLGNAKIRNHAAGIDSLVLRERILRAKITALESELISASLGAAVERGEEQESYRHSLNEAQTAYHRLLIDLKLRNPAYYRMVTIEPPDIREIRETLPDTTAILEYFFSEDLLFIFVILHNQVNVVTIAEGEKNVRGRILLFRGTGVDFIDMEKLNALSWVKPLQGLYTLLIAPLEEAGYLTGIRHLIIVPGGYLHYLPFQALITHFDVLNTESIRPFFLVEKYDISYSPSASLLLLGRSNTRRDKENILLLAPQTDRLPQSESEVQQVARSFGSRAEVCLAGTATERLVKEKGGNYHLLHFATTAHFNQLNALFSRLDMAASDEDDGHLEVHEIYDLDLQAGLTTLSACQTALGSGHTAALPRGEDLVGLTRAFLYAGSASVLASLWEVADPSTAAFMVAFYERLRQTSKVHALTETQRDFITRRREFGSGPEQNRYFHPYYWAPFVLVGNWQ